MTKKHIKISVLTVGLILAVFGVKFGMDIQFSKAASVSVQLTVSNPVCGNGMYETSTEQCDDGNTANNDGCDSTCHIQAGWTCSGTLISVCTPICGDGVLLGAETCDDNNTTANDGCSAVCRIETGWTCSGAPSTCYGICGDGLVRGTEQCDDHNLNNGDGCDSTCRTEVCGNGLPQSGEQCDDGNTDNTDSCTTSCKLPICGDAYTRFGVEQCDDGNLINTDACTNSCLNAVCGDNYLRTGTEQCDDGNILSGDGCDSTCHREYCGDTIVQTGLGEQCDDGNSVNGDSCDTLCYNEICGNGRLQYGEQCDDGNTTGGEGCSATCGIEAGWLCSGSLLSCCSLCGDGIKSCAEECDNGKQCQNGINCTVDAECLGIGNGLCQTRSGDGCDSTCHSEGGGHTVPTDIIISSITAYPELRSGSAGTNYDAKYYFSILSSSASHQPYYIHNTQLSTLNNGTSYPYVTIGGLNPGIYDTVFKSNAHLSSSLKTVYLSAGDNDLNFTNPSNLPQIGSSVLTAGDIDNSITSPGMFGDDVINSVDISILLQYFGQSDPSGNGLRCNLNQDAVVNETDLNMLLNNLDKEANY